MKRDELAASLLLIPIDAAMIVAAFLVAYWLRLQTDVIYLLPFSQYSYFVLSVLPFWLVAFGLEGLYRVGSVRRGLDEFAGIFVGVSLGVLLVMATIFLTNTELNSRVILLYAYVCSLLFVWLGRWAARQLQELLFASGFGLRPVVVIGDTSIGAQLAEEFKTNTALGYRYLGYVATVAHAGEPMPGKRLGTIETLPAVAASYGPHELILADSTLTTAKMLAVLSVSNEQRIDLRLTPNLVGVQTLHVRYQPVAGIPLITIERTPLSGWGKLLKRVADVAGSALAIAVLSPVMLLTALAVRLTSPGPVIYKNERVGQDKRLFHTYKFRTMRIEYCTGSEYGGAEALQREAAIIKQQNTRKGAVYKIANDPRLTPIGDLLRRTSLDELPQFFNVLFGTMSLVGPRPHQPREVARYKAWQEKLFTIKPGITGLAQISGRSDLDFDDEARLDVSYIENWSPWFDFGIFVKTPFVLLQKRKAA